MQINYSAFHAPMPQPELDTFVASGEYQQGVNTTSSTFWIVIATVVASIFALPILLFFLQALFFGIALYVCVIVSVLFITQMIFRKIANKEQERQLRIMKFCKQNNMAYQRLLAIPDQPGLLFDVGNRQAHDALHFKGSFDIANYTFRTATGTTSTTYTWGYVAIQLDRHVPHMLLDSRQNNTHFVGIRLTDLLVGFRKDQVLELEGDFNKYFTLYAPNDYKSDAYYVFTPDLMALLIDYAADFDLETIDDQLIIYSKKAFDVGDPVLLERLFKIIDTVGRKTYEATDAYVDQRAHTTTGTAVAHEGRRLKRSLFTISGGLIILIIVCILLLLG